MENTLEINLDKLDTESLLPEYDSIPAGKPIAHDYISIKFEPEHTHINITSEIEDLCKLKEVKLKNGGYFVCYRPSYIKKIIAAGMLERLKKWDARLKELDKQEDEALTDGR